MKQVLLSISVPAVCLVLTVWGIWKQGKSEAEKNENERDLFI